jgi:cobalt-zinc-cadmium efflux system membrane fusion protein
MMRSIRSVATASLLCAGMLWAGCDSRESAAPHEHDEHGEQHEKGGEAPAAGENLVRVEHGMLRDLRVTMQAAESRPAGDAVTALGELRVNEDAYAEVGTSIAARVARVFAAPGDRVSVGQPLVELDSPEVGRARAALLGARSRLGLARRSVERRRDLARDQIVSERDLQAAEAELEQAEAESRAASESLAAFGAVRGSGAQFVLTAPIAGTVIERSALRGRMVDAQHPLFIIGDLSRLWLVVHAFERDALRIRSGASARVSFPALPAQSATGKVKRIGSRVDPTSRSVEVLIELDNPEGNLRPGMSASALVSLGDGAETVVTVPVQALQHLPEGWCVFLPRQEEGVFESRPVGRGRDLDGEVEVLSGLSAGERVVVDGAFLLKAEADKARGGADEHHH